MIYVCVEREAEFDLHLYVCKETIRYFFAGGYWNYTRDSIVNMRMNVFLYLKLQENQLVIDKTVHGCLHRR